MKRIFFFMVLMLCAVASQAANTVNIIIRNPLTGNYDGVISFTVDPDGQLRLKDVAQNVTLSDIAGGGTPELVPGAVKDFHLDVGIGADQISLDDIPDGVINIHFSDERAQDAVGGILFNTSTINLTYDDVLNKITADINPGFNAVSGTGVINTIPKWTATDVIGNSNIFDAGSSLNFTGDIIPTASGAFDLGSDANAWDAVWIPSAGATDNGGIRFIDSLGPTVVSAIIYDHSVDELQFRRIPAGDQVISFTGDVIPRPSNGRSLGTDDQRWEDLYVGPASIHIGPTGGESGPVNEVALNFDDGNDRLEIVVPPGGALEITDGTNSRIIDPAKLVFTSIVLTGDNVPYVSTVATSYAALAEFIYPGTTLGAVPVTLKAVVHQSGATSMDIRIFDLTNTQVITEVTGITFSTPTIQDLGAISNLPSSEAILEVQLLRTGGGGAAEARCSTIQVTF